MPSILGMMTLMNADRVAFICLIAHAKDIRPCRKYRKLFSLIIFLARTVADIALFVQRIVCRLKACWAMRNFDGNLWQSPLAAAMLELCLVPWLGKREIVRGNNVSKLTVS